MDPYFFIPSVVIYCYVSTISSTMLHDRYKKRIIWSIISLVFGIIFEIFFSDEKGYFYIALSSVPILHLICYEILRTIFKPWIGEYAYSPYKGQKIGSVITASGYPYGRTVKSADYTFGITLFFLPFILVLTILLFLKN